MNQPDGFLKSRSKAFKYAFSGWWFVIRTQRNAWIHMVVSVAVIIMSLLLHISPTHWALILLAIALVWIAEFLNTALEAVVDLATNHAEHELARVGKDVGAAAVLIAAASSMVIGLLILGPPLWAVISSWF
ncbi:MAG TPA: diacylglycerol kinase family protein [Anaerolineales bacterium]|nr:diacylglycerol kinase family protein [Anaerolineales bacterium]